jgi:lysophospholipase L1-like esterase
VRRSRLGSRLSLTLGLPITVAVVLFAVVVVPATPGRRHVAQAAPASATTTTAATTTTTTAAPHASHDGLPARTTVVPSTSSTSTSTTVLPSGPVNVVLLGDSTSVALLDGLDAWAAETADRTVGSVAHVGCGLITEAVMLGDVGNEFSKGCRDSINKDLPRLLTRNHPDTALIMVTVPDVTMRQWSGDEGMIASTDMRYLARMVTDYRATVDTLIAAGVRHVAFVAPPPPAVWWIGWESELETFASDTWTRYSAELDSIAADYPGVAQVVRLDEWFDQTGATFDETMRDDGLHLTPAGARRVMDEFLGPVLLRLTVR